MGYELLLVILSFVNYQLSIVQYICLATSLMLSVAPTE